MTIRAMHLGNPFSHGKRAMLDRLLSALAVGVALVLAAGAGACSSAPSSPAPLYSAQDATKVAAHELFAAYVKDKTAANGSYKGKLLEVSGVTAWVGTDPIFKAPEVIISGGAKDPNRGVDCVFDTRYASQVARLRKGQAVTVLGKCDGYAVNVVLLHCQPSE
jgi:tRNA_anti-like